MTPKLSIIIPCYNCENTLREAVDSCYTQGLENNEFEVVMVDDGSTDGTRDLMHTLAEEHSNIRLVFHKENRGGGAARNTGIKESSGEIIYCLDSDNFFTDNSALQMINYLKDQNVDGVAFYERRFFIDKNPKRYTSQYCEIINKDIILDDLFSNSSIMLDNFFYLKSSFDKTNKYPEHHGFDTQAFEIDFLARKLKVRICPDSFFYHRQNQRRHKSYYEKEYEKGLISINTFLALEPSLDLFEDKLIELIANFDLFKLNYHGGNNLRDNISKYIKNNGSLLRNKEDKRSFLSEKIIELSKLTLQEDYESAYIEHMEILKITRMTPFLLYFSIRLSFGLNGVRLEQINDSVYQFATSSNLLNLPKYKRLPLILLPLLKTYLRVFKK